MYDRKKSVELESYTAKITNSLRSDEPLIQCVDNYNDKFQSFKFTTKKTHAYDLANFTVVGLAKCDVKTPMKFVYRNGSF